MSDNLKLCPFCGEQAHFNVKSNQIFCENDNCRISTATLCTNLDGDDLSSAEILKNWNTRPLEDALRAERDAARAEVERLRAALEDYADKNNWLCEEKESRYGNFYIYSWKGDSDPWFMAQCALEATP